MKKIFSGILLIMVMVIFVSPVLASSKVNFTYTKIDKSFSYPYGKVTIYYQYPKLKGNGKTINKINKQLKADAVAFVKQYDKADFSDWSDCGNMFDYIKAKVTYNKKGILSIRYEERFYLGGISRRDPSGTTFDIKSGKRISLKKAVIKKYENVNRLNSIVYKKLQSKYPSRIAEGYSKYYMGNKDIVNQSYYLKSNGDVVICFPQYSLEAGAYGSQTITIKGRY